ncbi:insulinase family protein [Oculatella sp. LEGE 06141]|nr:insulinase family protein [Oculatella sp. LEGE 06141]
MFSGAATTAAEASSTPSAPSLSLAEGSQKTVLDNGLTVVTKEIHTAPVVSVQVWYRVGSRNEQTGENGISHQLEHLLFKGTSDRPIQFGRLFNALGSQSNAFTYYDETAYFNTVESNKLDAILALEADRMQNSLIEAEQLDSEKRVVISELQGYENRPSYRLGRAVMRAAFPNRSYGLPVGGTKSDVEQFTVEQVKQYYQTYYAPNNATLVITGDFATESILPTIEASFGTIPNQGDNPPTSVTPAPTAPTEAIATAPTEPIVLREPGSAALLEALYPLPNISHPDVPAIDLLDTILTGGRSSRLYQALVESGLASSVAAYPEEPIEPGWYSIYATAAPGQAIANVDRVLQQTLATLQQSGVTEDELNRAKTQLKTYLVLNNQDVSSQASQLAFYQAIAGDYQYGDRYLAAIDQVTVADIQRVAQTYLDPAKRTVGFFEPTVADGQAPAAGGSSRAIENFSPGEPVDPAEVARYLPPITAETDSTLQSLPDEVVLDNGLRVLLLPSDTIPMVNLSGWVEAGSSFDPENKAGLASLTAENLLNGTQTRDALTIATSLEDEGASLSFSAAREGVSINGYALPEKLPTLLQTLTDVLQQASFPADQLELSRQRSLISLKVELDDPQQLGWRLFRQAIYPANHPFHSFPTEETLSRISQADLARFYRTHYRPDTTVLALVGNFNPDEVRSLLNTSFGNWQAEGKAPRLRVPSVSLPRSTTQVSRAIPGKAEAVTYMGYNGIARQDSRYYAALVLNEILGGNTLSSRLGTEIRDRQGLTYGINSFFQAGINSGPFAVVMQTAPEDVNQAIDSTLALLKQLRQHGITNAELEAAKRSIMSTYPVELSDPNYLTYSILRNEIYGLDLEEIRQFPQQIEAVTLDQVQQAIEDLIHPDNLVIVTAGPGSAETTSSR